MSSRLFVDLREKQGLAYVVGSLYPSRAQASRFALYIGTDPVNQVRVQEAFTKEVARLQNEPIPEKELAEAKSKLIGNFALAHDTNVNQAYYLGLYEALGLGYSYDALYPKAIAAITSADIQAVAKRVFSAPGVLSVVQPEKSAQP
jgi:predicted Zn-dependent peptidase